MRAAETEPPAVDRKWSDEAWRVVKTGLVGQSVWRGRRPTAASPCGDRPSRRAAGILCAPGGSGRPAVFVGRGSRPGPPPVPGGGRQHVCARAPWDRARAWGASPR